MPGHESDFSWVMVAIPGYYPPRPQEGRRVLRYLAPTM